MFFKSKKSTNIKDNESISLIENQVKIMNEYNGTNFKYVEGRDYSDPMSVSGNVPKRGLGDGWHGVLIDYIEKYRGYDKKMNIALIAESKEACEDLNKLFKNSNIDNIVDYQDKKTGIDFDIDLNIKQNFSAKYDIVLTQALLEHIVNPFMAIENFSDLLIDNGLLVLHTHNIKMQYHPYPIDCIRFYKDFFENITQYIDLELLEYLEASCHIFCVYRRIIKK